MQALWSNIYLGINAGCSGTVIRLEQTGFSCLTDFMWWPRGNQICQLFDKISIKILTKHFNFECVPVYYTAGITKLCHDLVFPAKNLLEIQINSNHKTCTDVKMIQPIHCEICITKNIQRKKIYNFFFNIYFSSNTTITLNPSPVITCISKQTKQNGMCNHEHRSFLNHGLV